MILGLLCGASGLIIYGVAPTPFWFCLGIPVAALWGIATSAAQQIMTARVGADAQGKLQGAGSSLMAIGNLVGPVFFTQVFAATLQPDALVPFAGLGFVLAGTMLAAAAIIAERTTRS
jgi:DHA1 family tetracycline resistance protein-like MFS transporter